MQLDEVVDIGYLYREFYTYEVNFALKLLHLKISNF